MKKKAIIINPKFLPEANGVIACLKNVTPYFSEYFDLTIVTAKTVSGTKKNDLYKSVKIKRLSTVWDDLYVFFKERFYSKTEEEKALNKNIISKIIDKFNVKSMHLFEHMSKSFGVVCADGYERNFYRLVEGLKLEFDYVICPVMPRANALIASQILEKCPEKKMIFLQLDMYYRNPDLQFLGRDFLKEQQRHFYEQSEVVAIQPGFMKYIDEDFSEYKSKILPLHVPSLNEFSEDRNTTNDKTIHVVYAGSFLEEVRPPQQMLEFLSKVCSANSNIKLHLLSWGCQETVDRYKKIMGENLILHGFLPMEEASEIIENADILVNIGNKIQEMMPSKTFEYIGRRKPIIHFYYSDEDISKEILEKYPIKLFVNANSVDGGISNEEIEKTFDFICENKNKLCEREELNEKYSTYTAKYYVDTIVKQLGISKEF